LNLLPGDVVEMVGTVGPFGTTMQIAPITINNLGNYEGLGLPASLLDAVPITTSDANMDMGNGTVQVNWNNLAALRGQYVSMSGVSVVQRDISSSRPDWLVSSDNAATVMNNYDTSLRVRNDRSDYSTTLFNPRTGEDGDFVPPPPGSRLNMYGFITNNGDDPFNVGLPGGAILSINVMEDADIMITESPPIVDDPEKPSFVPGSDPLDITATITPDPSRTVVRAELKYTTSESSDTTTVTGTNTSGNDWTFQIPVQADGVFVTYWIEAEDSEGGVSESSDQTTRFITAGITNVSQIQETGDGGPGDSPFRNAVVDMDLNVTVQSDPADSWGFFSVQDDAGMAAWSGVLIDDADVAASAAIGDQLNITNAEIVEVFGVTVLQNVTATNNGAGTAIGHKVVGTDVLQDPGISEAHEGMQLRFENVTMVNSDTGFGECSFSSDGTEDNAVEMDDASGGISSSFCADTFDDNNVVGYIQGTWWFSFGEYKLIPSGPADIGVVTGVEGDELPEGFALEQNYPNPFNPSTTIRFALDSSGPVQLQVYDLLGRQVATIVDREMTSGPHTVSFDGASLASGMYIYRLSAGKQIETRTMTLLK
ncbi:MAG: T9SS type A sorting domain-containing protein, partial [Rhodothermales bacterium]|nr:T9SS type A sorting domain-containing protein [Rhodothermales bacterium]